MSLSTDFVLVSQNTPDGLYSYVVESSWRFADPLAVPTLSYDPFQHAMPLNLAGFHARPYTPRLDWISDDLAFDLTFGTHDGDAYFGNAITDFRRSMGEL